MVARWNTTRDRLQEDERRVSLNEVVEMDGTTLYEREDWPLSNNVPERSVSPETVISISPSSKLDNEEDGGDHVAVAKAEDNNRPAQPSQFDDGEVSDMEDDSEDSTSERRMRVSGGSSSLASERHGSTPDPAWRNTLSTVTSEQEEQLASQRAKDESDAVDVSPAITSDSSPAESTSNLQENSAVVQDNARAQAGDVTHSPSLNGIPDIHDEGRDMATPIQFGMDGTSESMSSPSSPPAYGRSTPNTNGHLRQGSMVKGTPPSRNSSSRRSQHITPLRDRLRYSWQSAQEEEPNRPRIHIIKLISNTATASAGFPQGEAFGFSMSPGGRRLAAYNSARLYILQTAALPVGISQDFALKRRPLAVEVVDEGGVLAILADEHTVNIYDLGHQQLERVKTIKTDFPTTCIALSPTGALLAAAYEGGVEIFSLAQSALPTDRRAVRCPKMDRLAFSEDSSTLLGTTVRINCSSTMAVSVPVFPSSATNIPTHEELKEAWCSELLHPENVRNSSHAIFMRENRETCNDRLFAWNGLEDTFGILNISDMQYGAIEFPVVISPPLSTCGGLGAAIHSPPSIDEHGDTVAMIVNDRTIRLYIVPHKLDDEDSTVEAHSIDHELDEGYGCPFTEVRWVHSSSSLPAPLTNQTNVQGRLVVASPGGVVESRPDEEPVDDIEGGRIILFDFDPQFAGQPGQTFSLTLGKSQPQLLEEPAIDVEQEVALVRRRTVNQSKGGGLSTRPVTLGRAASTVGRRDERAARSGATNATNRTIRNSLLSLQSDVSRSLPDLMESSEALDTFEEPYAQGAPRSQASLMRAASNAQRHRFQTLEERNQERVSVDSTGGFLPLPEYTEEPNAPLPSRFRAMAGLDTPAAAPASKPTVVTNANGDRMSPPSSTPSTAPAATAETFSSESAFQAASTQMQTQSPAAEPRSPTSSMASGEQLPSPITRSDTFDSLNSMPRSLRRAYGNLSPVTGTMPAITGTWGDVTPPTASNASRQAVTPSQSSTLRSGALSSTTESVSEEESADVILPAPVPRQLASSPFSRARQSSLNYRYSTSLLNPPGHPSPTHGPPSISSFGAEGSTSPTSTASSRTRRLPPHMQAFRNAAVSNSSASLFPPNLPADHVPVREPSSNAGSVPHPVTAWHPPGASSTYTVTATGSVRGHSRKSSTSNRSAFASTSKAKKLGFFRTGTTKKKKNNQLFGPEFAPNPPRSRGREDGSMMETKSMFTTMTGREKCVVM
jgi:hypothetical protein